MFVSRFGQMTTFVLANMVIGCAGNTPKATDSSAQSTYQLESDPSIFISTAEMKQSSITARQSTPSVSASRSSLHTSASRSSVSVTATRTPAEDRLETNRVLVGQSYDFKNQLPLERGYKIESICLIRYMNDDGSIVLPKKDVCLPNNATRIPASLLREPGCYILGVNSFDFRNFQIFLKVVDSDKDRAPLTWGDFVLEGHSYY